MSGAGIDVGPLGARSGLERRGPEQYQRIVELYALYQGKVEGLGSGPSSPFHVIHAGVKRPKPPKPCVLCKRPTKEPRKGMCFGCYLRDKRGHSVTGPCSACGVGDQRVLKRHRLSDGQTVLCANCSAIAGRRAVTLEVLRGELGSGRRMGSERRGPDRRGIERRQRVDIEALSSDRRSFDRRTQDNEPGS